MIVASALSSFASSRTACNDLHECRTLEGIIFNCISTVILCTWVALHTDVPARPDSWTRFLHRVKWVTIALLAPEAILYKAFVEWTQCSTGLKRKIGEFVTGVVIVLKLTRGTVLASGRPGLQLDGNTCNAGEDGGSASSTGG